MTLKHPHSRCLANGISPGRCRPTGKAYSSGDLPTAWHHLERAHVIGQRYPVPHTYVHWKMLQFGFRIKSGKEIAGQSDRRLLVAE